MRHRRALRSAAQWTNAAILAMVLGCERAGRLVVVLDRAGDGHAVDVVAIAAAEAFAAAGADLPRPTADSIGRLRAIEDSAATLGGRFRASRDSINRDVAALDSLDRRTRSYAVRYADLRRRTLAAEQLRGERDAMRARADTLRARLAPILAAALKRDGDDSVIRVPAAGSVATLQLAAGEWLIGIAAPGSWPRRLERATVRAGQGDTLRLAAPRR
jgi:hypothetical protein